MYLWRKKNFQWHVQMKGSIGYSMIESFWVPQPYLDLGMNCMMFPPVAWSSWNDFSWHWIEGIHHVQLDNNLVEVKVQGASNAMDCVAKASQIWRHKTCLVNWYNIFFTIMEWIPLEVLVMAKRWDIPKTCNLTWNVT
jgi:hypothetical protein